MFDIYKPKYRYSRLLYELMRTTGMCVLSILAHRFQTAILMLIILRYGGLLRLRWTINNNISAQLSESLQHAVIDYSIETADRRTVDSLPHNMAQYC